MRDRRLFRAVACCLIACGMVLTSAAQTQADLVYTIAGRGVVGISGFSDIVETDEAYIATFQVDADVLDSDSDISGRGVFLGAILSSSIRFSGGHTATASFAGGDVIVLTDNPGGSIAFSTSDGEAGFTAFTLEPSFSSDAILPTSQELASLNRVLFNLPESDGPIAALGSPATVFVTTAVPEPSTFGLLGLGVVVASVRRRRN